ncbi:unnamed protein product [Mytilus coruscus]|uniref:CCHC-type domain-containing protein n=1 Tax=Mytilus coruscus TaxID=42192 RepID=A0A6J8BP53_MYTCO|nr:unnamed protein product [Mytilus coruscus]
MISEINNNVGKILKILKSRGNDNRRPRSPSPNRSPARTVICYTCNQEGHYSNQCENKSNTSSRMRRNRSPSPINSRTNVHLNEQESKKVSIRTSKTETKWQIIVADITDFVLLGLDVLQHLQDVIDLTNYTVKINNQTLHASAVKSNNTEMKVCKTRKDYFPLPRIESCIDTLRGTEFMSCLDMSSGYYHLEIHEDD